MVEAEQVVKGDRVHKFMLLTRGRFPHENHALITPIPRLISCLSFAESSGAANIVRALCFFHQCQKLCITRKLHYDCMHYDRHLTSFLWETLSWLALYAFQRHPHV